MHRNPYLISPLPDIVKSRAFSDQMQRFIDAGNINLVTTPLSVAPALESEKLIPNDNPN